MTPAKQQELLRDQIRADSQQWLRIRQREFNQVYMSEQEDLTRLIDSYKTRRIKCLQHRWTDAVVIVDAMICALEFRRDDSMQNQEKKLRSLPFQAWRFELSAASRRKAMESSKPTLEEAMEEALQEVPVETPKATLEGAPKNAAEQTAEQESEMALAMPRQFEACPAFRQRQEAPDEGEDWVVL